MKKSLFGYSKDDVDIRIAELQETIKMYERKIASLEEKSAQAQKTIAEKNEQIERMSDELSLRENKSAPVSALADTRADSYEKTLANIGQIYMLAYDSASSLIKSSQKNVEDFLDKVSVQTNYAQEQAQKALSNIQQVKMDMFTTLSCVLEKANDLQEEINALVSQAGSVPLAFRAFTSIRQDVGRNIDRQLYDYMQKSKGFIDEDDLPQQEQYTAPSQSFRINMAVSSDLKDEKLRKDA